MEQHSRRALFEESKYGNKSDFYGVSEMEMIHRTL